VLATAVFAQIPERNCISDPFMRGCKAEIQSRKIQENLNKGMVLNPAGVPAKPTASSTSTPAASPVPVADNDWQRPRLANALPPDWPRWTFAPADASLVVGMKLGALMKSPLIRQIMEGAGLPAIDPQMSGPHPDEVWLTLRPAAGRPPESVILLLGTDVGTVAADLRSKGATVCFLDTQSILVGEWNAVNRALQRVARPSAIASPYAKRARELWTNSDLWFIASGSLLAGAKVAPTGVTAMSMGLSLQDKLVFDVLLNVATPEAAAHLAAQMNANPGDLGFPGMQLKKVANGVSLQGAVAVGDLPDTLRKQITDQIRPLSELASTRNARPDAPKNAIVIQGLDDGPRVIAPKK
jgi:hypothetical protein